MLRQPLIQPFAGNA